jgi:hypothetical protein
MDPKSETLLKTYRKEVEKTARGLYLQTVAIRREIERVRINPEDKYAILVNCINLLTTPANDTQAPTPETPQSAPGAPASSPQTSTSNL